MPRGQKRTALQLGSAEKVQFLSYQHAHIHLIDVILIYQGKTEHKNTAFLETGEQRLNSNEKLIGQTYKWFSMAKVERFSTNSASRLRQISRMHI